MNWTPDPSTESHGRTSAMEHEERPWHLGCWCDGEHVWTYVVLNMTAPFRMHGGTATTQQEAMWRAEAWTMTPPQLIPPLTPEEEAWLIGVAAESGLWPASEGEG